MGDSFQNNIENTGQGEPDLSRSFHPEQQIYPASHTKNKFDPSDNLSTRTRISHTVPILGSNSLALSPPHFYHTPKLEVNRALCYCSAST